MDIQCKRKRAGGTVVTLEGTNYHFTPREDGRHVATVNNPKHANTLLKIAAYEIAVDEDEALDDVDLREDEDKIDQPDGERPDEQDESPVEGDDPIDPDKDEGPDEPDEGDIPLEDMDHAQLIDEYAETFGKAPHPATKPENLRAKIAEAREAVQ